MTPSFDSFIGTYFVLSLFATVALWAVKTAFGGDTYSNGYAAVNGAHRTVYLTMFGAAFYVANPITTLGWLGTFVVVFIFIQSWTHK